MKSKKKPGTIITISDHPSPETPSSDPTPSGKDQPTSVQTDQATASRDEDHPLQGQPTSSEPKTSATVPGLNVHLLLYLRNLSHPFPTLSNPTSNGTRTAQ